MLVNRIAFVLLALATLAHGRLVQLPTNQGQDPWNAFANFLLAFNPAKTWYANSAGRVPLNTAFAGRSTLRNILAAASTPVLRFRDACSQQEISIVGTTHGSPASVKTAEAEILSAQKRHDQLGAVVIELCPSRWKDALDRWFAGEPMLTTTEFMAAARVAQERGVPVMLGDADIDLVESRLRQQLVQGCREWLDPFGGGWRSLFSDLRRIVPDLLNTSDIAESDLLLDDEEPLSMADIRAFEVPSGDILNSNVDTIAWILGVPNAGVLFLCSIIFNYGVFSAMDDFSSAIDDLKLYERFGEPLDVWLTQSRIVILVLAISAAMLQTGTIALFLFVRLVLVALLEDRNVELARSIRRAAKERQGPVVAVLGGAHVNGVARILMSGSIPETGGYGSNGVWVKERMDP